MPVPVRRTDFGGSYSSTVQVIVFGMFSRLTTAVTCGALASNSAGTSPFHDLCMPSHSPKRDGSETTAHTFSGAASNSTVFSILPTVGSPSGSAVGW